MDDLELYAHLKNFVDSQMLKLNALKEYVLNCVDLEIL